MKNGNILRLASFLILSVYCVFPRIDVMAEDAPIPSFNDMPVKVHPMARGELDAYGIKLTINGFMAGLKHKEPGARSSCLLELGNFAGLDKVSAIAELCDDPVKFVRDSAISAIHRITFRHTRLRAEQLWKESKHRGDRVNAVMLLLELGDPSRYGEILDILKEPTDPSFAFVVTIIPKFAKYQIVKADGQTIDWVTILSELFTTRTANWSKQQKRNILSALQQIGSTNAMSVIKKAFEEETDSNFKQEIKYYLERGTRENFPIPKEVNQDEAEHPEG